jgi:hypothetical protein
MKVTLLLTLAEEGYRVLVIEPGPPTRTWLRFYPTKRLCMGELHHFDLMTSDEAADAMLGDFDERGGMLVFDTETDDPTLAEAGFESGTTPSIN